MFKIYITKYVKKKIAPYIYLIDVNTYISFPCFVISMLDFPVFENYVENKVDVNRSLRHSMFGNVVYCAAARLQREATLPHAAASWTDRRIHRNFSLCGCHSFK